MTRYLTDLWSDWVAFREQRSCGRKGHAWLYSLLPPRGQTTSGRTCNLCQLSERARYDVKGAAVFSDRQIPADRARCHSG